MDTASYLSASLLLLGVVYSAFAGYLGDIFLLLMSPLLRYEHVAPEDTADEDFLRLQEFIRSRPCFSSQVLEGQPCGLVVGRWFVAHIQVRARSSSEWLLAPKHYPVFARQGRPGEGGRRASRRGHGAANVIATFRRITSGPHKFLYRERAEQILSEPTAKQALIVERVVEKALHSQEAGEPFSIVVLISGPPGGGKSRVAEFLAKRLNGALCAEHVPVQSGDSLFALNDWEQALDVALRDECASRAANAGAIHDRASYCRYLDGLSRIDGLITVLTQNRKVAEVMARDGALLRPGRVGLKMEMGAEDVEEVEALLHRRYGD